MIKVYLNVIHALLTLADMCRHHAQFLTVTSGIDMISVVFIRDKSLKLCASMSIHTTGISMEYDWAQSAEQRYQKGIVLSPNLRVTGWAQIIMVKGVLLLMPKSVNNTLNTKVQCCGRHQVNPAGSLNEGEKWCEDNKVGGKWLVARSNWCHQTEISTSHLLWWFVKEKFPLLHSCFLPSALLFHLHRVDLVSPSNVELWCSSFCSLTLVSVMTLLWPWLFVLGQ